MTNTTRHLTLAQRTRVCDTLTPLALYDRVALLDPQSFLLESLEGGEHWARYSFIGVGAVVELRGYRDRLEVLSEDTREVVNTRDPFGAMASVVEELGRSLGPLLTDGTRFGQGAVGYVAWDAVRVFEPKVGELDDQLLLRFVVPRVLIGFDLLRQRIVLTACAPGAAEAEHLLDEVEEHLNRGPARVSSPAPTAQWLRQRSVFTSLPEGVVSNTTRDDFCRAVERSKEYIRAGDIIQVVLSQRLSAQIAPDFAERDLIELYRRLRLINPSPYLFLLNLGDEQLIGASPEVLVRKTGNHIEVRPIAGTRPRGGSAAEDRALAAELLADDKELAEHIMLVDLGRNDLGRVSTTGSVEVAEQMVIERYSHVMHIVSHVVGELSPGRDWADVLAATFPAGTLSGAPKVRALQIIDELESTPRGVYGGAVGYVGFDGNMDLCIAIRTLHAQGNQISVQAGAGIVADSDPATEWQETLNKASALLAAL